ncbi:MAG TPA: hypothetical protein VI916_00035 [Acidimicrobiia bacterium]|nr:hypothetical protein [Acidimicrobiia bacterium]
MSVLGVMVVGVGFSVTDDLSVETMLDKLESARSVLLLGGALEALAAMALVIFGAWIFTVLRAVEPPGALTALVAGGGSLLTAAMLAMAAAHTQLATYEPKDSIDPAIPLTLHTLEENLYAGAWCSLALVAGAVAVAALRHRVLPTWFGGVSAFIAVLLLVLQIVVPWGGWFPAAVWLVVAGFGLRATPVSVARTGGPSS